MRLRLCLLLLVLVPAVPAGAQVGRLGMTAGALRERLGPPQAVREEDGGMVWLYDGRDTLMTFAYYLRDSVIVSTDVVIAHSTREAALERLRGIAGRMKAAGWQALELNPDNYLFHTGDELYRAYVLREAGRHLLMLSHMHRSDARAVNGKSRTSLLAYHAGRGTPDPDLVALFAAPPESPPSEAAPSPAEPPSPEAAGDAPEPITFGGPARRTPQARRLYTWVVASVASPAAAEANAATYRAAGLPVGIYPADVNGRTVYRVGVGAFRSWRALKAGRAELPAFAPADAWPLRMERDATLALNR